MTQSNVVGLTCTSCGAKLDISDEMDRYTCSYCGTEMMIERHGTEVAVRGLADMLREMQDGANKHAAEMALARYAKELNELRHEQAAYEHEANKQIGRLAIGAVIAGCVGGLFAANGEWLIGLVGLAVAFFCAKWLWRTANQRNDSDINPRIFQLKLLIKEKERIANG